MAYIEFKNVCKEYKMGEVIIKALDNTNFLIEKGELVVIVGPSGAGKTTALNILGGMDHVTSGEVIVDDKNLETSTVLISWYYYIDKKVENEWKEIYYYLTPIEIAIGHLSYPYEAHLDWSKDLGELEPGTYRIRYYPILNQSKEVEFNIN